MASNPIEEVLYQLGIDLGHLKQNVNEADSVIQSFGSRTLGFFSRLGPMIGVGLGASLLGVVGAFKKLGGAVTATNSQMETYETRLMTLFQNQEKVRESLENIVEFAASTPFEIPGLVAATVQLESFEQNAEKWLPLVGEFAAAMSVDIESASRAVARALSGSAEGFEILRNNGISNAKLLAAGWSGSVQDIESTASALEKVLGSFSGGMERQSRTFTGIMSNISDLFTQFQLMIGNDFFPRVKDVFDGIRERLQEMFDTGEAQRWVNRISAILNFGMDLFAELLLVVDRVGSALDKLFSMFERRTEFADLSSLTDSFEEIRGEVDANINRIETLKQRYAELEEQARANGQTVSEAAESNEELRKVMDEIVEVVPEAATGFDEYNNALGVSINRVEEFLSIQRELNASELRKLAEAHRKQFDEINSIVDKYSRDLRSAVEASRVSLADLLNAVEQESLGAQPLPWMTQFTDELAPFTHMIGELRLQFQLTDEALSEVLQREPETAGQQKAIERLTELYEWWGKTVSRNVAETKTALGEVGTELAVTESALQRFVRISGLESAIEQIRQLTQIPNARRTQEDANRLAIAYSQIADVFNLDFRRGREQVVSLAEELMRISQMDFSIKGGLSADEEGQGVFRKQEEIVADINERYQELLNSARLAATEEGKIFSEMEDSAKRRLELFELATKQILEENQKVDAETIKSNTSLVGKRISLLEEVLKVSNNANDRMFESERERILSGEEFERASLDRKIEMLDELADKYAKTEEAKRAISEEKIRQDTEFRQKMIQQLLKEQEESTQAEIALRKLIVDTQAEISDSVLMMLKAQTREEIRLIAESEKTKLRMKIEANSENVKLVEGLENQIRSIDAASELIGIQMIERRRRSFARKTQEIINENMSKLRAESEKGIQPKLEDKLVRFQIKRMMSLIEDGSEFALSELSGFNTEWLKKLDELGVVSSDVYRSILENRLKYAEIGSEEEAKIINELRRLEREREKDSKLIDREKARRRREEVRRIVEVTRKVKELADQFEAAGLMSAELSSAISGTMNVVAAFTTGGPVAGIFSVMTEVRSFVDSLLEKDRELRKERMESIRKYGESVDEVKRWEIALGDEWTGIIRKYTNAIEQFKDSDETVKRLREQWRSEINRLANEVVPVLDKIANDIRGSLEGIITDSILEGFGDDFETELRQSITKSIVSQIVGAFVQGEAISEAIKGIVTKVFRAEEAMGGGRFFEAQRIMAGVSDEVAKVATRTRMGAEFLSQVLGPLTDFLVGDDSGIKKAINQVHDVTQSMSSAITEPQGSQLISIWTVSRDYLRDIKTDISAIRLMLESYQQLAVANNVQVGESVDFDRSLGNSVGDSVRSIGLNL